MEFDKGEPHRIDSSFVHKDSTFVELVDIVIESWYVVKVYLILESFFAVFLGNLCALKYNLYV